MNKSIETKNINICETTTWLTKKKCHQCVYSSPPSPHPQYISSPS